jgi:hypothetical protein
MGNAYDSASLLVTPNGYKASKIYSAKPTDGTGDLAFSRASTAMRRNSAGLWEEVANNVPRLQYPVGGGCPSWLFEPQATNICTYNNDFTNAAWDESVSDGTCTVSRTANYTTVEGFNATRLVINRGDVSKISSLVNYTGDTSTNTKSLWIKNNNVGNVDIMLADAVITVTDTWTRYTVTNTYLYSIVGLRYGAALSCDISVAVYQFEAGSVATSPIITAGSAVTRLADVSEGNSKITGTDFTWFVDFKSMVATNVGSQYFGITENGTTYGIWLFTAGVGQSFIRAFSWTSSGLYEFLTGRGDANISKIAFVKSGLQIKTFINGVLSETSTIPVQIPVPVKIKRGFFVVSELDETITYDTAISDTEAIELTTL